VAGALSCGIGHLERAASDDEIHGQPATPDDGLDRHTVGPIAIHAVQVMAGLRVLAN
jgi:hypothetical protein